MSLSTPTLSRTIWIVLLSCIYMFVWTPIVSADTNTGKVGHWTFDRTSGSVASDNSGNGNSGSIRGAARIAGEVGNGALHFDGYTDYVEVPDADSLDLTSDISISAWINFDLFRNHGSHQMIVAKGLTDEFAEDLNYYLGVNGSRLAFGFNSDVGWVEQLAGVDVLPHVWRHVTVTFSDDANMIGMYLDGQQIVATGDAADASMIANAGPLFMSRTRLGEYVAGSIDDVRIYNRALSGDDVRELYLESEGAITRCNDQVDNDEDGLIDFPNDPECNDIHDDTEMSVGDEADTEAPSTPTTVRARALSSSEIEISWEPSTDNVGVFLYHIYRDGEFLLRASGPTYVDEGLESNTEYSYTIEAYDGVGNKSSKSAPARAWTEEFVTSEPPATSTGPVEPDESSDTQSHTDASGESTPSVTTNYTALDHMEGENGTAAIGAGSTYPVYIAPPQEFTAIGDTGYVSLEWVSPKSSTFKRVRVIRNADRWPLSTGDGAVVYEGAGESYIDGGLMPDTTYYYAIFALDTFLRSSAMVLASAVTGVVTPPSPSPSDVDVDDAVVETLSTEADELVPDAVPDQMEVSETTGMLHMTLAPGDDSEEVRLLQQRLNELGYVVSKSGDGAPGNESTYFGAKTALALQEFQEDHNIVGEGSDETLRYGVLGPATLAALNAREDDPGTESDAESVSDDDTLREILLAQIAELTALVASLTEQLAVMIAGGSDGSHTEVDHTFSVDVREGDIHTEVFEMQKALNSLGFTIANSGAGAPGQETTYFGPSTTDAIMRFQCEYDIVCGGTPDTTGYGSFGPKTRATLSSLY